MFIRSTSLASHLFVNRLVKTESNFIVSSLENGLRRQMQLAGGSCDYCWCLSFFAFSDLTCHLEYTRVGVSWLYWCFLVFSIFVCCLIVRRTTLEVVIKRLLYQLIKKQGSFSVMLRVEMCPYSYFRRCVYFRGPSVLFVTTDEF